MKKKFNEYLIDDDSAVTISSQMMQVISEDKKASWLACINPHSYVTAQSDYHFSVALQNADWLIPDGIGIVMFSAISGEKVHQRVAGGDVFYELNQKMSSGVGKTAYFLGSTEATLEKIKIYMAKNFPKIEVVGTFSPPFRDSFDSEDTSDMVRRINAVSPDVLWVGLTAPKQEKWLNENINLLDVKVAGAVGAVFDFCAGNIQRAPLWMQRTGLEWLHRSLSSPSKLGKRNAISNPIFLYFMVRTWLAKLWRIK